MTQISVTYIQQGAGKFELELQSVKIQNWEMIKNQIFEILKNEKYKILRTEIIKKNEDER